MINKICKSLILNAVNFAVSVFTVVTTTGDQQDESLITGKMGEL